MSTDYSYKQLLQLHKLQLATGGKLLLGEKGIIIIRALKGPVPQDYLSIVGPYSCTDSCIDTIAACVM